MLRFLKWLRRLGGALLLLLLVLAGFAYWLSAKQGASKADYAQVSAAHQGSVTFDEQGIPTVQAANWGSLLTIQGYVVASERMWQMDLMRRKMAGRLSEWFGAAALESDRRFRLLDLSRIAKEAVAQMIPEEKADCLAYVAGINRFIEEHTYTAGIEYLLTRTKAEPWSCEDSVLVLQAMNHELTSNYDFELECEVWRKKLSPAWEEFLYTQEHPWNKPIFGARGKPRPALPPANEFLPGTPLSVNDRAEVRIPIGRKGSNNWAYHGIKGYFLANDPHLGTSVPQLWYAMRLYIDQQHWVVGAALPGLPGVILGMNQSFGWAFTNNGQDIDDLLEETIDWQTETYLESPSAKQPNWLPLIKKVQQIRVRGQDKPEEFTTFWTHRGPVYRDLPYANGRNFSRQWLALKPEHLHVDVAAIDRAHSWDEFNAAINYMHVPAQNIVYMDRSGAIGLRVSGIGIKRAVSGMRPQPADLGAWLGFEPLAERPRKLLKPGEQKGRHFYIGTANERIWVDRFPQNWFGDDRFERIDRYLSARNDYDLEAMERLAFDTHSRFLQELGQWFALNVKKQMPDTPEALALAQRFEKWSGFASTDPMAFTDALFIEKEMRAILLGRVGKRIFKGEESHPRFYWSFERAILLSLFQDEAYAKVFGTSSKDLVSYLYGRYSEERGNQTYLSENRWLSQHPFVGRIPVIGALFKVKEFEQLGFEGLVRTERNRIGASMRLFWDLEHPEKSRWIFPIGQSGHVYSKHFKDQQPAWIAEQTMPTAVPEEWLR